MSRVTRKKSQRGGGKRRTASRVRSGARSKRCTRRSNLYPRKSLGMRSTLKGGSSAADLNGSKLMVNVSGDIVLSNVMFEPNTDEETLVKHAREICFNYIKHTLTQEDGVGVKQDSSGDHLTKFFIENGNRKYWFGHDGSGHKYRLERIIKPTAFIIGEVDETTPPIEPTEVHSIELHEGAYILSSNTNYYIPPEMNDRQLGSPILQNEQLSDPTNVNDLQVGHLCAVRNGRNLNGCDYGKDVPVELQDKKDGILLTVDGDKVGIGDWVAAIRNSTGSTVQYGRIYDKYHVQVGVRELRKVNRRGVYPLLPSDTFSYALVLSINETTITLSINPNNAKNPTELYTIIKNRQTDEWLRDIKMLSSGSGPYLESDKNWLCSWLPTLIKDTGTELVRYSRSQFTDDNCDGIDYRSVNNFKGTFSVENFTM